MDFPDILGNAARAALGPEAAILALLAIGLNLHFGYTGLYNFGQVGFMLLGAFGIGVAVDTWGLSMWAGIPLSIALAVVFAMLLGLPTLRLRADYFAIVTIAAAEILRFVARSGSATDITGGPFGLQDVGQDFRDLNPFSSGFDLGNFRYSAAQLFSLVVGWTLVGLCTFLVYRLIRSPWGRVIRSIREDEDVARSLGKDVFGYKMQSLIIGGVIGAIGGIMWALTTSGVNANTFQPQQTFFAYTILIIGGAATPLGPIVGAVIFQFIFAGSQSTLAQLDDNGWLPGFLQGNQARGALSLALVGLILAGMLAYRPQGIFGNKEEIALGR
jgi:neutral amino acid transport system permease protein